MLAVFGLVLAALVLPGAASALVNPSILSPTGGAVLGVGARTFTFSMPGDDGTATGYSLLRAAPSGGVCDSIALASASAPTGATASGPAPLAPAPLVDSDAIADGQWCYWVESTDGLATADSSPVQITVDTTPPTVNITSQPASFTQSTTGNFSFTVSDGTRLCQLDGGAFTSCTTSTTMSYSGLAETSHTFTVQSTDAAGNVGSDTYSWTVDHTNPIVMISPGSQPSSLSNSGSASFVFSDNEGTPQCKLDSGSFGACSTSTTMNYSGLSEMSHTFTVKSTDAAGNVGSDAYTWTVDRTPPTVPANLTLVGPASRNTQPSFTFGTSTDVHGPLSYRLYRDGTFTGLTASTGSIADFTIAVDGSNDGTYSYTVRAVDAAGNESSSSSSVSVTMDSGPPSVPANVHAAANPTRLGPVISWNASTGVPVAYQVLRNGSLIGTVNAPGTVFGDASVTADGSYSYTVRAVDGAGNTSLDSASAKVVYDTTAPGAPAVTAVAGPVNGAVTLSWPAVADAGSGVAGYQVRRSAAGGPAPASLERRHCDLRHARRDHPHCGDSGLTPGSSYRYAVFAIDGVGNVSGCGADRGGADSVPRRQDASEGADGAARGDHGNGRVALSWKNPKAGVAKVTRRVELQARAAVDQGRQGRVPRRRNALRPQAHEAAGRQARPLRRVRRSMAPETCRTAARATLSVPVPSPLSLAPGGKLSGSPALSWNAVTGATYYNVQVFEGTQATKRVAVAWPSGHELDAARVGPEEGEDLHLVRLARPRSQVCRRTTAR